MDYLNSLTKIVNYEDLTYKNNVLKQGLQLNKSGQEEIDKNFLTR